MFVHFASFLLTIRRCSSNCQVTIWTSRYRKMVLIRCHSLPQWESRRSSCLQADVTSLPHCSWYCKAEDLGLRLVELHLCICVYCAQCMHVCSLRVSVICAVCLFCALFNVCVLRCIRYVIWVCCVIYVCSMTVLNICFWFFVCWEYACCVRVLYALSNARLPS